ncbi:ABC transporter ATP-binding protein [Streptomyces sp. TLI_146]|uniref:ABC transporter ATP-binding protein n=1 Tax=Streptomyces sp. TLI_146 TaxID=1938858 RepID=UPI000C714906|nr:ABC transporter ATP-binding protein [Streptomyces sp. TLI_146]PKV85514.1 energy-coupling factor transport system ATP-binding protein [Streptomyces sp. TLI_146]
MIHFEEVSVTYEGHEAPTVQQVHLTVPEGELVLLIGPSGVGKSTLLGTVSGLVPHFTGGTLRGRVTVDGRDTRTHKPRELADLVGTVGQDPLAHFVTDTVEDELAYGMESLGLAPHVMRRRVEETLDLLGLADLRDRPIATLSGGQQQRVAIGSVLTPHPKVLVLDEPTSALDPAAAEEVLSVLQRLVHDLGTTVLMAEHRLERVIQYADRALLLPSPSTAPILGTPAEIMAISPVHPPVVTLGRLAGWHPLPLSVRDARRRATDLRAHLATRAPQPPTAKAPSHEEPRTDDPTVTGTTPTHAPQPPTAKAPSHEEPRTDDPTVTGTTPTHAPQPPTAKAPSHEEPRTDAPTVTGTTPTHAPQPPTANAPHKKTRTGDPTETGGAGGNADPAEGRVPTHRPARGPARAANTGLRAALARLRRGTTAATAAPAATATATVTELGVRRARIDALRAVTLTLAPGETTALMGRNGAGKSTLLNTLVGMIEPTTGTVTVNGRTPHRTPPRELIRDVGLVPQEPRDLLYADTVAAECAAADADAEAPDGTCRDLVTALLPGVPDDTHPRDLSEGQRLALALAIVLTGRPPLLLLDEPTRGLDYAAKARLADVLRDLAAEGHAIVLATHDVELAAEIAHRVVILADGEVVADGPTADVVVSSPSFAPQVSKILAPDPWLTVTQVREALA